MSSNGSDRRPRSHACCLRASRPITRTHAPKRCVVAYALSLSLLSLDVFSPLHCAAHLRLASRLLLPLASSRLLSPLASTRLLPPPAAPSRPPSYAANCDAFHITAPHPEGEGMSGCLLGALENAGLPYDSVDYINAHGTSTPLNDKFETMAYKT